VSTAEEASLFSQINPEGAFVQSDGNIGGAWQIDASGLPEGSMIVPTLRNVSEGVIRNDWVNDILASEATLESHIGAILSWVENAKCAGVNIAYSQIDAARRDDFTRFVERLAAKMHSAGKQLSIQVDLPTQISEDQWDGGAYDWVRLGQAVDTLRVPTMPDPAAHVLGGKMEELLRWATRQVDRRKIQLQISMRSREFVDSEMQEKPYAKILAEVGQLAVEGRQPWWKAAPLSHCNSPSCCNRPGCALMMPVRATGFPIVMSEA